VSKMLPGSLLLAALASLLSSAAFSASARGASPEPASRVLLVQRLRASRGESVTLDSEHFAIAYDPKRLSDDEARNARRFAEEGWARCERLFSVSPKGKLKLDLTPDFFGATGFARPGELDARDTRRQAMIGVRYPDLEYLGLEGKYVLAHEVGHIFSGSLAGTSVGEGVADWAAGVFSGIELRPWWGKALRDGGLWIDPDAFFITGEFDSGAAADGLDIPLRTAQYSEVALLIQFLVDRFGWDKTRAWAEEYGKARDALVSNDDRRRLRFPPGFRLAPNRSDPRRPPDPAAVRATFEKHFGQGWERLRDDWQRTFTAEAPPGGVSERLVLGQRIYGAVRSYEMWVLSQRAAPEGDNHSLVRAAFVSANRALTAGDLPGAEAQFGRAMAIVERLRHPQRVA
jgi:hypothetical protein